MSLNQNIDANRINTELTIESQDLIISVQNLYKKYGNFTAVRDINFEVKQGEIFGLIGPDGAGKSTTFHILGGVMAATAGDVKILNNSPREARLQTGYLTQQFSLYLDLSIEENLRYSAGLRQVTKKQFQERRIKYLRLMNLEKFSHRLVGKLSGGMKQKLALCCALISQPEVLLLDEPTTGVDPISRREFWDVLTELSKERVTIVVATPYLDEAERCDRIALMYDGQIHQIGTLLELRSSLGLHRLELRTNNLQVTEQLLSPAINADSTGISDIQTFGDRLDVLVKNVNADTAYIKKILKHHNISASIETTTATLENVFVNRLRQQGSDPKFIPFPRSQKYLQTKKNKNNIAICAKNLWKTYGNFHATKNLNLEVSYGEIYGLLGANGAGKTTTMKMLCGLLQQTKGEVSVAGKVGNLRSPDIRKLIGYMSQKFTLYDDLSVVENLEFYCGVYGVAPQKRREKIDWVLETCGLVGQENMLTKRLPGGWKQRVAFGASIMHEPEILFLDEPTSGVDPLARRQFWRLIEDLAHHGTAVLVTTHYLEEAEHCHRLGFMVAGEMVAQGSPTQIKAAQPGKLIELVTNKAQIAYEILKLNFQFWQVSLFGSTLHIVLENPEAEIIKVHSLLKESDLEIISFRSIPFSLEDAFIGIVQRAQK
ncbi:ATP-binding cassette domain-containing protein [Calothrix sp. UHCC 0171]|uniref:ATP-binding cassette domain-containing protein n=1 Tax=Calothrix sp. UHCC 0171 TaxID=3110245 RepID=UPI002B1F31C2|nr:ATP-binding cassette domain-containing protein [Calothrix sp. UHCC 0171]MEA5571124.1 ATP-binding cassette domain-containing protein [Calothrix sp. UHCC 0171]